MKIFFKFFIALLVVSVFIAYLSIYSNPDISEDKFCQKPEIGLRNKYYENENITSIQCPLYGPLPLDVIPNNKIKYLALKMIKNIHLINNTIIFDGKSSEMICNYLPILFQDDYLVYFSDRVIEDIESGFSLRDQEKNGVVHCQLRYDKDRFYIDEEKAIMSQKFLIVGTEKSQTATLQSDKYNVLFLGLDSLSANDFRHYLPRSFAIINNYSHYIQFSSYNVIGDGTTPNLLALLTGKSEKEFPSARRFVKRSVSDSTWTPLDDFPWLWNNYSHHGYTTHWIEDNPKWGTFQTRLVGFGKKPVDNYGRIPTLANYLDEGDRKTSGCIYNRLTHKVLLESLENFFTVNDKLLRFSLTFLSEVFHEITNAVSNLDEDLSRTLNEIINGMNNKSSIYYNTILVVFSDHGPRIGKFRNSYNGKIEERLPYMSMSIPENFTKRYEKEYSFLSQNADKLITLYDIHEAFESLIHLQNDNSFESNGTNIFKNLLSVNRSCPDAKIDVQWCLCLRWNPISKNIFGSYPEWLVETSQSFVNQLNIFIDKIPISADICSRYSLKQINSAEKLDYSQGVKDFMGYRDLYSNQPITSDHFNNEPVNSTIMIRISLLLTTLETDIDINYEIIVRESYHGNEKQTSIDLLEDVLIIDQYEKHVASCLDPNTLPRFRKFCICK